LFYLPTLQDLRVLLPNHIPMNKITLQNYPLTYHVTFQKNRRTLQIKLLSSSHLEITVPNNYPKESMEALLYKKSSWIIKRLSHLAAMDENPLNKSIKNGATVLYLGEPHTLIFLNSQDSSPTITLKNNQIILHIPVTDIQNPSLLAHLLREWYWKKAQELLVAKTIFWSKTIQVQPQRVTIKDQKTRWGSCSSKGNINYNWRIIMAPPEVIDYLIIHELSHLHVLNHSSLFWQEVSNYSPRYKEHRTWLQTNGSLLMKILPNT